MTFEVFKDGKRMFITEAVKCVPDVDTQKKLASAGYKMKLNGKAHKPGKVAAECY